MEDQNAPSQGDSTSQPITSSTLPAIATGLDKTELRQKMIEILASTANGCLQELGYYPGIHGKLQQLEKRAAEWQGENVKLYNDNLRLFAAVNQQKQVIEQLQAEDHKKTTAIQHLKVANAALNKSIEELEAALLNKGGAGPAELFDRKYNSLLKEYQTLSGEHGQAVRQLQAQRNQSNPVIAPQQQAQQPLQNAQQTHQVQPSQLQPQQQRQQQSSTQYLPHPTAPSHPFPPNAAPSIFASLSSHPVHHPPHQQNVVYQQQMQPPGTSSNRRPSGSMPGPIQQFPVQGPGNPYPIIQQQQSIQGQIHQYHPPSAPPNQPLNPYPNGPTHPPQRANTYPPVPVQSAQHPQSHPPQPQMAPAWTSSALFAQPPGNNPQRVSSLWVNTSNASVQGTSSPRTVFSPQTLAQTPNSAPFPPVSPHNSQFGRSSATPNAPSRPSSLSQASSPIGPTTPMPQSQPLNGHTPLHSPALKRNSLSISDMHNQNVDDLSHKRPRIDGPPQVPKDISGLPSPITPSMQHMQTMPGLEASLQSSLAPAPRLESSPASSTGQPSYVSQVQVTQPINPPVTPAQSQSPQPPRSVVDRTRQQEHVPEAEAMAVDVEQPIKPGSAEAPTKKDTGEQGGKEAGEDEDDEDEEIVEVGPDGLRLVSDCLDELFGKDRSGTFICKFCVVRHKMNLMSESPVTYESPSDEVLAQHLMADHKTAWDKARAVDD